MLPKEFLRYDRGVDVRTTTSLKPSLIFAFFESRFFLLSRPILPTRGLLPAAGPKKEAALLL